jgi:hypothetical protein
MFKLHITVVAAIVLLVLGMPSTAEAFDSDLESPTIVHDTSRRRACYSTQINLGAPNATSNRVCATVFETVTGTIVIAGIMSRTRALDRRQQDYTDEIVLMEAALSALVPSTIEVAVIAGTPRREGRVEIAFNLHRMSEVSADMDTAVKAIESAAVNSSSRLRAEFNAEPVTWQREIANASGKQKMSNSAKFGIIFAACCVVNIGIVCIIAVVLARRANARRAASPAPVVSTAVAATPTEEALRRRSAWLEEPTPSRRMSWSLSGGLQSDTSSYTMQGISPLASGITVSPCTPSLLEVDDITQFGSSIEF